MNKMLELIANILVIVGALNWGLIGLLNLNLVTLIFGSIDILVTIIYVLVGLSAVVVAAAKFMK